MKAIQITMDEALLAHFDADDEVRRHGRSAVLRRIAAEYLERRKREAVARQYRNAYGDGRGLGNEFAVWEEEGVWPSD
jgi:metal-responsive CopG/Arc/MetJ family transcriptional regulator